MQQPVYLDYHATTPCDPRVVDAILPFFTTHFGNAASRTHVYGWKAAEAVKQAREQVASLVGSEPDEIAFTSGATESDNLALKGVFELYRKKGNHIITCKTEHKAVLDTCLHLEKLGAEITYLDVDQSGLISLGELNQAIRPSTILISIMYANNETGVVQPIKGISAIARAKEVLFFTDATQAAGKIAINVNSDGIDLMALSAHKLYGPKGIGALYIRRKNPRVRVTAQIDGGGHERGVRSGTLNVTGIVGFGKACSISEEQLSEDMRRVGFLRNKLETTLLQLDGTKLNGSVSNRLPTVSNISFEGIEGQVLLTALNKKLAVSSGAACSSASMEPSHVLKAMGLTDELAYASIRFSMGRFTTEKEVEFALEQVRTEVEVLRRNNPFLAQV